MQEYLYGVGQHVSYAEDGIAWPWRGGHEIVALLPVGGDEPKYQIRSADRSYDRVVQEHELAEDFSVPPLLRARAGGVMTGGEMTTEKLQGARDRAEAQFQKREKALREGDAVRAEYAATFRAMDDKTARLKSLRLAKEAADVQAEAHRQTSKPKKKRKQG